MFKIILSTLLLTASISFAKDVVKDEKRAPSSATSYRCTTARSESSVQGMIDMCENGGVSATTSEGGLLACCLEQAATNNGGGAGQGGGR